MDAPSWLHAQPELEIAGQTGDPVTRRRTRSVVIAPAAGSGAARRAGRARELYPPLAIPTVQSNEIDALARRRATPRTHTLSGVPARVRTSSGVPRLIIGRPIGIAPGRRSSGWARSGVVAARVTRGHARRRGPGRWRKVASRMRRHSRSEVTSRSWMRAAPVGGQVEEGGCTRGYGLKVDPWSRFSGERTWSSSWAW